MMQYQNVTKAILAGSMAMAPAIHPSKNFPATSVNAWAWAEDADLSPHRSAVEAFSRTTSEVKEAFDELVDEWRKDTMMLSNQVKILMHPAHYKIIGMGPQALPHIFADLVSGGGPWFLALEAITHENPVLPEHKQNAKLIRADWTQWGREHGYIQA